MRHLPLRRILVAPSGFKESLDASEVAQAISAGVRKAVPGVRVLSVPVADGGEGTAAALAQATCGRIVPMTVTGPVGKPVQAHYAMLGGRPRARRWWRWPPLPGCAWCRASSATPRRPLHVAWVS